MVDPPNVWQVEHAPGADLELSYELRPAASDSAETPGNSYQPVVRNDLVHLIGETALVSPEWYDEKAPRDIRLTWTDVAPRGWKTATSFDGAPAGEPIRTSLEQFRHGLFVAGRLRVHDRDVNGRVLRVSIFGEDWDFSDEEFVDLTRRIVAVERDFFADHSDPYYLVSLIPVGRRDARSRSIGGTGLTNSFAMFIQPGPTLKRGSDDAALVARLLAHEYFHHWNGQKIPMESSEQRVYWFSEGFTDFYASRLLHRAGLIDAQRWTQWLNDGLREYWTSPARSLPNQAIEQGFWKDRHVQTLPYRRGEIVALLLDWEIRRRTEGRKCLDDFLREVLSAATQHGEKLSTDGLLARAARWTCAEFAAALRGVVERGDVPAIPGDLLAPALRHEMVVRHTFDAGFDAEPSAEKRVVTGVRDGGAAHRAGLRDGQKIAGLSIHQGDATKPVRIVVQDAAGGGRRTIEYLPHGDAVRMPEFTCVGKLRF